MTQNIISVTTCEQRLSDNNIMCPKPRQIIRIFMTKVKMTRQNKLYLQFDPKLKLLINYIRVLLVSHHCCEDDTDPDKWIDIRYGTYRDDYGYYETMFDTYNQGLCTPITATSTTAQNPM